jgi:hypothetical protein
MRVERVKHCHIQVLGRLILKTCCLHMCFSSQPQPPPATNTHLPYPVSSSGPATSLPYSSSRSSTSVSTATNSANFSTIQPEHIRASLLSAIEDRIKIRISDRIGLLFILHVTIS